MSNTFDFAKVEIKDLNGHKIATDGIKADLCNKMYVQGETITKCELGQKLWHAKEPVKLTKEEEKILREEINSTFRSYLVRTALLKQLDEDVKTDK
jgi:hypothetical protein